MDEPELSQVLRDDNHIFLLPAEDIELVNVEFPNDAQQFQREQVCIDSFFHYDDKYKYDDACSTHPFCSHLISSTVCQSTIKHTCISVLLTCCIKYKVK